MSDKHLNSMVKLKKSVLLILVWIVVAVKSLANLAVFDRRILHWSDRNAFRKAIQFIIASVLITALYFCITSMAWSDKLKTFPHLYLVLLIMCLCVVASYFLTNCKKLALPLIFSLALLLRLLFIFYWKIEPISDFEFTYSIASNISKASISDMSTVISQCAKGYNTIWSVHMPFVLFQAAILRLFGDSI